MDGLVLVSKSACHSGRICKYQHYSQACQSTMTFNIYLPRNSEKNKLPGLFYLSGITCNEDNFIQKSCAIRKASQFGLYLICPDTSPRNTGIEGEDDAWDLGSGAGFYVDATEPKWKKHYKMYSYINDELPALIYEHFDVDPLKVSIFGHSMGGHGALVMTLRNPDKFLSCSAFAPICNPTKAEVGKKVFQEYLGTDSSTWTKYDATELLKELQGKLPIPILISQGSEDEFYINETLLPHKFEEQINKTVDQQEFVYKFEPGFDHSYWFVQTFIEDHLDFHARHLKLV